MKLEIAMTCLALAVGAAHVAAAAEESDAGAATSAPPGEATLEREADPVSVLGEDLGALLGRPFSRLALFSTASGTFGVVPFQIDERLADGSLIFTGGKEHDPTRQNEILERSDELVFMARDCGDRVAADAWPAGADAGIEIEVAEPGSGRRAWAYLLGFEAAAPRSPVDYVRYDPGEERITAETYSIQYTPGQDHIFFSNVSVPPSAGGDGVDFVDRLKLRTYIKTRLFFSLTFHEEEWESVVARYLDGPVRAIRQVRNTLSFMGLDVAPTVEVDATYYPSFHYAPAKIQQTINLRTIASEAWFRAGIDLDEHALGMRYYRPTPGAKSPFHAIDGKPEPDEGSLNPRDPDWHLVTGAPGTLLWVFDLPEPLTPVATWEMIDDVSEEDPPESTPGSIGQISVRFDLFPLEKGTYLARLYYLFPPHWEPGREQPYLDVIRHPLEVTTRAIAQP